MPANGPSPTRSLDDDSRRRAFLAAAVVVVAATVGISLVPEREKAPPRAPDRRSFVGRTPATVTPTPTASTPAVDTAAEERREGPRPMRSLNEGERDAIVAQAAAFLRAYLAYEVGGTDAKVRRDLRRTATRSLARQLLRRPPDLPARDRPSPGRVISLELGDNPDAPVVGVSATIARAGHLSPLSMHFDRERGRWRVSRVS